MKDEHEILKSKEAIMNSGSDFSGVQVGLQL